MSDDAYAPFSGANALIFGGAKGIGRAVAMEWARRGARLAIADIDEDAAKAAASEVEAAGGKAIGVLADVMSEESLSEAASAAEAALGQIAVVMNNVGGMLNGHPEDIPMREWQRIMDLNYFAAVRGVQHFLPQFQKRGSGHFVNTASFAGFYPYAASRIPYAAAKAAVISMTQNYAIYCEPQGIRFSCLIPGPVATQVMDSMTSWTENCPMRGPGVETTLMLPDAVARKLSDGMAAGEVLIPSDDVAWNIVRRWAAGPDVFVREKISEFEGGERGNPAIPEEIRKAIGQ